MNKTSSYKSVIRKKYKQIGVLGSGIELHKDCQLGRNYGCWEGYEHCDLKYHGIVLPHLGQEFDKNKLLVVAVNNRGEWWHKHPDINSETREIRIRANHIRDSQYDGSKDKEKPSWGFYERIADYSIDVLALAKRGKNGYKCDTVEDKQADVLINSIAFTQAVKCNPKTATNYPNSKMFKTCPANILIEEIKILKPEFMLILGVNTFDNVYPAIAEWLEESKKYELAVTKHYEAKGKRTVEYRMHNKGKYKIHIIGVRHPSRGPHMRNQLKKLRNLI